MNLKETKVLIFVILLMSTFIIPTSAYASISTTQSIPSNDFLQIISGLFSPLKNDNKATSNNQSDSRQNEDDHNGNFNTWHWMI